jgi:hypothetical protein
LLGNLRAGADQTSLYRVRNGAFSRRGLCLELACPAAGCHLETQVGYPGAYQFCFDVIYDELGLFSGG